MYNAIPFAVMLSHFKKTMTNAAVINIVESALHKSNINIGGHSK
jgi:hypothetical protein